MGAAITAVTLAADAVIIAGTALTAAGAAVTATAVAMTSMGAAVTTMGAAVITSAGAAATTAVVVIGPAVTVGAVVVGGIVGGAYSVQVAAEIIRDLKVKFSTPPEYPPKPPPMQQYQPSAPSYEEKPPPYSSLCITQQNLIQLARETLNMDVVNHYNYGVCGSSGTGKSTFINSLRNLKDVKPSLTYLYREDESAPVNRGLSEVTTCVRRYIWPNNEYPHLALWDLPGGSTKNNRTATYFQDKALYAFDCLLLLTTARFTELDFDIVQQACNCGTPIVLVLTKVDQEVKNELEENPEKPLQEIINEIVSEFKQSARRKLSEVNSALVNVPIYAVSATKFRKELNNQPTDECSSLEMLALLQYCSNAVVYRRGLS